MEVVFGLENIRQTIPSVVTVGTFDGVHLGHKKIINSINKIARENNLKSTLITFDPHPRVVLQQQPSFQIKLLTKLEERLELLQNEELDRVIIAKFSREFSELDYKEFIKKILLEKVGARVLIVGYDHGFGRDRSGNFDELKKISEENNFTVIKEKALTLDKTTISSSIIREMVEKGNVSDAAKMLGRLYSINGVVVRGEGRGKKLRFPTANLQIANDYKLLPKLGVYAVDCLINNKVYRGMSNIGTKPTFGGINKTVEIHILDFHKNIYGEKIDIKFIERLRNEKKFKNEQDLINQLEKDKNKCLKI
jgi:riboflavin kinase/FMN adenylyltransferase